MKFGFCIGGDVERVRIASAVGADYVETGFEVLARDDGTEYDAFRAALEQYSLKCESANCFIPGGMKLTGENVDYEKIGKYVDRGMDRGKEIGLKTVVFGSGGARSVPESFPFDRAFRQLVYFLREIAGPIGEKYGINVVVEPLCDCNIIKTAKEGVMLAAAADRPNVFGLVDLFHMAKMQDNVENIRDLKGMIGHAHIAEPSRRVYPKDASEYDYKSFIDALEYAGCPRCSVEAGSSDFAADAPAAIQLLRIL